jgi:hypothetical protein
VVFFFRLCIPILHLKTSGPFSVAVYSLLWVILWYCSVCKLNDRIKKVYSFRWVSCVQQFDAIFKGLADDLLHFWFGINFWTPFYFSRKGYMDFLMSVEFVVWSIFLIWNMVYLRAFSCFRFSTGSFYNCASSVTLWRIGENRASEIVEFVEL